MNTKLVPRKRNPLYPSCLHTHFENTAAQQYSYIHHSYVGDWNKFPSCEFELFVGCGDDEYKAALKRGRSSHPVAPPGRVSHTFSLKECAFNYK
jgi:hypothetical protein